MKIKKPNVLLISFIFSPNIGGVESHLDDLVESLTKASYKVVVITYQPIISKINAPSFEQRKNLEIRRIVWLKFNLFNRLERIPFFEFLYLVPSILLYSFFFMIFNKKKIDVIQAHGFNMAIVGAFLSKVFKKRLIINTHVTFHFTKGTIYTNILQYVLNTAEKILVLTKQAKSELVKIGVQEKKIIFYHQWIDTILFRPKNKALSREQYKLPVKKFIVLFTGRFIKPKGVHLLLEASKRLHKNIILIFVGSGPLADTIKKHANDNSSIHFVGEIKREDLPFYYSSSDVCIIPSIQGTKTYSEGIPRVMIEAFSCGTPVLSTQSGGLMELINEDVGFFVSPNSQAMCEKINYLYKNRKKIEAMRVNCIRFAKKHFDKGRNMKIIEKSLLGT